MDANNEIERLQLELTDAHKMWKAEWLVYSQRAEAAETLCDIRLGQLEFMRERAETTERELAATIERAESAEYKARVLHLIDKANFHTMLLATNPVTGYLWWSFNGQWSHTANFETAVREVCQQRGITLPPAGETQ